MEDDKRADTKIIFGKPEEIASRRQKTKSFHSPSANSYLLSDEYEQSRILTDLMILEGFSEEFILRLMCRDKDDEYALTLDFLHSAALLFGETYVREHLLGKTVAVDDAISQVREELFEDRIRPYRELYDNLDDKLKAALTGEEQVSHQLEILKLQNTHAQEMYKQRMENAEMQFKYELRLENEKSRQKEEKAQETIRTLEAKVKELEESLNQFSDPKKFPQSEPKKAHKPESAKRVEQTMPEEKMEKAIFVVPEMAKPAGELHRFPWPFGRKRVDPVPAYGEDPSEEEVQAEERRNYCIQVLGNGEFSEEQVELILSCMENEKIPTKSLQYICNPKLPVYSMRAMIRFLGGGEHEQ